MNTPKGNVIIGSMWLFVMIVQIIEAHIYYPYQTNWITTVPYVAASIFFYSRAYFQYKKYQNK